MLTSYDKRYDKRSGSYVKAYVSCRRQLMLKRACEYEP
jgi:hypothetical protein